ncbi:FAD/NAD(P)-binding protein [Corynebacterium mastitidis]|uniref:FAD/NAD(P)-binding protein n=1 Tax=Corynebacterium mastitidis TaxID=161890 RepID=UPI00254C5BFE|nr:FAD/NAD(P)-binding protein [Corynebacterium mastitidis]MDK8450231.1 FAD/NAD(P)-binding protein [Corynebacterium mastitidis]
MGTGLGSFDRWRLKRGEAEPLDPFPPRSRVGEFLGESWRALFERPSPWHAVRHVPRAARPLERQDEGWLIDGEAYAEVLVATGHAATWPGALPRTPRVLGVYPTGQLDPVAPGVRVAVRGTALTFIDAALDLTVGRGGSFTPPPPTTATTSPTPPAGGSPPRSSRWAAPGGSWRSSPIPGAPWPRRAPGCCCPPTSRRSPTRWRDTPPPSWRPRGFPATTPRASVP